MVRPEEKTTPPLSIFRNWMLRELSDSVSFLGREPNTHCQSLFSLNSVYPKWPCSRSWPFLSLDVLISWIKLCSWSQSNGYSHKPREVLISSMFVGVTYSFIYKLLLAGEGTLHHCSHLPKNWNLNLTIIVIVVVAVFRCTIMISLYII